MQRGEGVECVDRNPRRAARGGERALAVEWTKAGDLIGAAHTATRRILAEADEHRTMVELGVNRPEKHLARK